MTFDERLEEVFKNYKLHHKDIDVCFHDYVAESAIITAIKQAIRETMPRRRTDENMPIDEWLEKHPHVSPDLSHEARLQVAASRMFGWNECVDEIEKGFGL